MHLHVQPNSKLHGSILIPGSKSQSVRGLLLATLAKGCSTLHGVLDSDDTQAALATAEALGASIEPLACNAHQNCLRVTSNGVPLSPKKTLFQTSNSGITTRFLLPILGLTQNTEQSLTIQAGEQMQKRPMHELLKNLKDLGMQVDSASWPLKIRGALRGGVTHVSGITSQFISALLLSAAFAPQDSEFRVDNLNERPYMELTLHWLRQNKIQFTHQNEKTATGTLDTFHIKGGQSLNAFNAIIPGDYSSASSFLALSALCDGAIELSGLDPEDPQGDRELLSILEKMGGTIKWTDGKVRVHAKKLHGITIDANAIPDLVPTLAVLGTQASGETWITNVPQARLKETDRLHSMAEGLKAMGAEIEEAPDGLRIRHSQLHGAHVRGYEDHRTIMALAIAGCFAQGEVVIDTAEGLSKTYPQFGDHLKALHALLHFD